MAVSTGEGNIGIKTPGLVFATGLEEGSIQRVRTFAPMAEARGFRNFLITEQVPDALALAQYAASVTKRIHIGTAVTNIYLRPALAVAFQALTIDRIAPRRLFLGLGTSHAIIGSPQECIKQIETFEQAGATYVIIDPIAIDRDAARGMRTALDAFAR